MKKSTESFLKLEITEAERLAKIGYCPDGKHLPQYYNYTKLANLLKAILLIEAS